MRRNGGQRKMRERWEMKRSRGEERKRRGWGKEEEERSMI